MCMIMPNRQVVALLGLLAAMMALGGAWVAETQAGLVPCALCLIERWPFRILLAVSALALAWPGVRRLALAAGAVTMLAGAGLGVMHVGVEQHWWPSPLPECSAPALGGGTMAQRLARMPARPAKPCDEPVLLIPGLPISFAGLQLAVALALAAMLATSALRTENRI